MHLSVTQISCTNRRKRTDHPPTSFPSLIALGGLNDLTMNKILRTIFHSCFVLEEIVLKVASPGESEILKTKHSRV